MPTLKVEIVTPESALWVGEAKSLTARSSDGGFTILSQHTETVGDIIAGIVRVETDDGDVSFAVHGGYFQVGKGEGDGVTLVTVLAGVAERSTDIDVPRALAAKESAEAALAAPTSGDPGDSPSHLWAHSALERAELRLLAAGK